MTRLLRMLTITSTLTLAVALLLVFTDAATPEQARATEGTVGTKANPQELPHGREFPHLIRLFGSITGEGSFWYSLAVGTDEAGYAQIDFYHETGEGIVGITLSDSDGECLLADCDTGVGHPFIHICRKGHTCCRSGRSRPARTKR